MKKLPSIIVIVAIFTSGYVNAQQKYFASQPGSPVTTYSGAHGPFYNGTLSDPTIPPRSAVPVGSLKGIKRNFTGQVITGDERTNRQMVIGDDLQNKAKAKATSKKKSKYERKVW